MWRLGESVHQVKKKSHGFKACGTTAKAFDCFLYVVFRFIRLKCNVMRLKASVSVSIKVVMLGADVGR